MSLGSPIQHPSAGCAWLLWHERHFESVLTPHKSACALSRYRSGGNLHLQSFGDALIGPLVGAISVGFEEDTGIPEQLSSMSLLPLRASFSRCSRSASVRLTMYFLFLVKPPCS